MKNKKRIATITCSGEQIVVQAADNKGDCWREVIENPSFPYFPYGREFHWTELTFQK